MKTVEDKILKGDYKLRKPIVDKPFKARMFSPQTVKTGYEKPLLNAYVSKEINPASRIFEDKLMANKYELKRRTLID